MDCCEETVAAAPGACPACGAPGRRIGVETVEVLAREAPSDGSWRFCGARACEVVWFEDAGARIVLNGARVRVHQKEDGDDRPACYCFGYAVADVRAGLDGHGENAVATAIAERCRRGEHRCARTNPQGACCLGNVMAIVRPT